jgi:hypothetical protein
LPLLHYLHLQMEQHLLQRLTIKLRRRTIRLCLKIHNGLLVKNLVCV